MLRLGFNYFSYICKVIINLTVMVKQILIKDRIKNKPADHIEEAMREAKSSTSKVKRTPAGIRIKRLADLLILF